MKIKYTHLPKLKQQTILYTLGLIFLFSSCIPQREVILMQDQSAEKDYTNPYQPLKGITDQYILRTNDYLFINISTPDPNISEFFNKSRSGGGNMQQNQQFFYYQIDDNMNIDFPYVGEINLKDCTVKMGKERLKDALKPFLKDDAYNLTFKLASNTFTALGEFRSQGVHTMQKEQITIFEAVATAGGITPFGKKKRVKIVRQLPNGPVTYFADLTDKNLINSEYYYIYPNDLLYIKPMRAKQLGIGESFSLGVITSILALYLTINSIN